MYKGVFGVLIWLVLKSVTFAQVELYLGTENCYLLGYDTQVIDFSKQDTVRFLRYVRYDKKVEMAITTYLQTTVDKGQKTLEAKLAVMPSGIRILADKTISGNWELLSDEAHVLKLPLHLSTRWLEDERNYLAFSYYIALDDPVKIGVKRYENNVCKRVIMFSKNKVKNEHSEGYLLIDSYSWFQPGIGILKSEFYYGFARALPKKELFQPELIDEYRIGPNFTKIVYEFKSREVL